MKKIVIDVFPCNIYHNKRYLYFNDDEYLCFVCKGVGGRVVHVSFSKNYIMTIKCNFCLGSGKVDFVTNLIRREPYHSSTPLLYDLINVHKKSFKCSSCKNKNRNCKRLINWGRQYL